MVVVKRACPALWSALLCLIALVGCGGKDPTESDLVGTWVVTDESRSILPVESREGRARLIFSKTGEFISDSVPAELLYSMPGMTHTAPVSGTGTWKVGKVDSDLALLLTFRAISGPTALKVPNGTQLLIDNRWHETLLYFFIGDPDQGKRVDFKRLR